MLKNKKFFTKQNSFTLIELLVVIMIIVLISTIIITLTARGRGDARDAKRKADLDMIKTAVEMYYDKTGTYVIKTPPDSTHPTGETAGNGSEYWDLFNCDYDGIGPGVSLGKALELWGFLNPAPVPPGLDRDTNTSGDRDRDPCRSNDTLVGQTPPNPTTFYGYAANKDRFSVYAGLEYPDLDLTHQLNYTYRANDFVPDGFCNGTQGAPYDPPDSDMCALPPGYAAGTAPYCDCHTFFDKGSSSGTIPNDANGSYVSRWSNYRVGNGK